MLTPGCTATLSNGKFTQHGKTLGEDEIFENAVKSTLQHVTHPTDKLTSVTLAYSKLYFFPVSHPTTSLKSQGGGIHFQILEILYSQNALLHHCC